MRERHDIELVNETAQIELLTAILMANLLVQRKSGSGTAQERRYGYPHSWRR
jgi:hypothetical protein